MTVRAATKPGGIEAAGLSAGPAADFFCLVQNLTVPKGAYDSTKRRYGTVKWGVWYCHVEKFDNSLFPIRANFTIMQMRRMAGEVNPEVWFCKGMPNV